MTVREFARRMGRSTSTIYRYIRDGLVRAVKVGRRWKVTEPIETETPKNKKKPRRTSMGANREQGFYGSGTPQVVIYGPEDKPYATATSPHTHRNYMPRYYNMIMPEGATWEWVAALQLNDKMKFWAIICDYKGPEKYDPDDLDEAPEELRELIGRCRAFYRRRAILKTARKVEINGVQEIK